MTLPDIRRAKNDPPYPGALPPSEARKRLAAYERRGRLQDIEAQARSNAGVGPSPYLPRVPHHPRRPLPAPLPPAARGRVLVKYPAVSVGVSDELAHVMDDSELVAAARDSPNVKEAEDMLVAGDARERILETLRVGRSPEEQREDSYRRSFFELRSFTQGLADNSTYERAIRKGVATEDELLPLDLDRLKDTPVETATEAVATAIQRFDRLGELSDRAIAAVCGRRASSSKCTEFAANARRGLMDIKRVFKYGLKSEMEECADTVGRWYGVDWVPMQRRIMDIFEGSRERGVDHGRQRMDLIRVLLTDDALLAYELLKIQVRLAVGLMISI